MATKNPASVASITASLTADKSFSGGSVYLGTKNIGSFVTYGKINPSTQKRTTMYGSRIYSPVKIQVEAVTRTALLNKIAAELSKAMKAGSFPSDY
jgi:hypothetical protein